MSPKDPRGHSLVPHGGSFRTMRNLSEVWHSEKKGFWEFLLSWGGDGQSPDPLPSPSLLPGYHKVSRLSEPPPHCPDSAQVHCDRIL